MGSNLYIYKRIVQSKLFIDAHYSEAIDLDNIADEAYFSKFHFIRLFKSIYGKTPHQYLISVRVEQSKLLLQKGLTVTQSCTDVGFESLTSFTALFKKYVRLSPSEYQRIYLAREEQIRTAPLEFIPACFASQYGWN